MGTSIRAIATESYSPDEKRALLRRLLSEEANKPKSFPLSFGQQRLWFLHLLEPDSPVYNMSSIHHLPGSLKVDALDQSLNEIVRRHEILRTRFCSVEGQPLQEIYSSRQSTLPLPVVDLSGLCEGQQEIEAKRQADAIVRRPFDLSQWPLLRVALFRLAENAHILVLSIHHIICDDWSVNLLANETALLYEAISNCLPSPLQELPIQYSDYALWQRRYIQGEVFEKQLDHWKHQMADAPGLLELPADFPRPAVQRFHGKIQSCCLPPALSEALRQLSHEQDVTMFMMLLAAYKVLLYRYSGQEDIVIGIPIAGRNRSETENLIGFFVNTLAIRTRLHSKMRFRELLSRVRDISLEAYANQDLPFEKLVEELQPERALGHTPLFQVMFDLKHAPSAGPDSSRPEQISSNLKTRYFEFESATAKFDLSLAILDTGQSLSVSLEYSTDLFADATITRMMGHFRALLEAVVTNPDEKISDLTLIPVEESNGLKAWNAIEGEGPSHLCIHQLFEAQVERSPDAIAVEFNSERINYDALNRRANRLAHYLRAIGVEPEVIVGIRVDRSLEMVVGILGTLKAGGAYLPIDPASPKERLAFMLNDARARVLLTQKKYSGDISDNGIRVICLDSDWDRIALENSQNVSSGVSPQNLAYIIYTTGSTGTPKGVMIEHRSLVNYTEAASVKYAIDCNDRILQFASISFDTSAEEIYPSLICGARLILRSDSMIESPPVFLQNCHDQGITVLNLPTAYWHELAANAEEMRFPPSIRTVIIGGEKALPERLALWRRGVGRQARLINTYGPTETTIVATTYEITGAEPERAPGNIPIGRPVRNVQTYILDRTLQQVPIGIPGELHIGGRGVARGYLNRPQLSAEKFIPDSFSGKQGAFLYKTGDRARYSADGNIEFLGRTDHQVKIRGFRIELGEIEATLRKHPMIADVVVTVREDLPGEKRLAAYPVFHAGHGIAPSLLRVYLRDLLPDYMIPSAFIPLEKLPLTHNGKIDRQSLPEPSSSRVSLSKKYVAPRSAVEQKLAGIWAEVLRTEVVGVEDNFFELGGDSILSIQIVAKANRYGVKLTPKQIFQHQTIAELAEVAGRGQDVDAEQGVVEGEAPLTPIQEWFFERELPEEAWFNQSVILEFVETIETEALEKIWRRLVEHHDALRLRFKRENDGWKQKNAGREKNVILHRINLRDLGEQGQRAAIRRTVDQIHRSLNLEMGPVVRAGFFDLGDDKKNWLVLIAHHLVTDAVSWRILLEDFRREYQRSVRGEDFEFPLKTTSYKQWATRLLEYSRSKDLLQEIDYWQAEDRRNVPNLPVDYSVTEALNVTGSAQEISRSLDVLETERLLRDVPAIFHTQINDVLLMALAQAFSRWTGERRVLVDLEGHGREEIIENIDLSRTVGWFTTIFPVLLDLRDSQTPADALKLIQQQLQRIPNRGIGYGLLRYLSRDLQIRERFSELPQAEIIFNYLGQFDQVVRQAQDSVFRMLAGGLTTSPQGSRSHLLQVNGIVLQRQLHITWNFSKNIHRSSTIESLADWYMEALRSLLSHCKAI